MNIYREESQDEKKNIRNILLNNFEEVKDANQKIL